IAAFDLVNDFAPELEELLPHLVREGRPGIAAHLLNVLGPDATAAFGHFVVEESQRLVAGGSFTEAHKLLAAAGVSYVITEFGPWLDGWVQRAISASDDEVIVQLLQSPLSEVLSSGTVHMVAKHAVTKRLALPGRVTRVFRDRY